MMATWRRLVPCEEPYGYVIPATSKTGRDKVLRRVNTWLSNYIPDRTKKLHELRKQAGSEVLMRNKSPLEAAKFIRDSVETTLNYYANLLEDVEGLSR